MLSACRRHQAVRKIPHPWNSRSLPHAVSTTHVLLANCTTSEIICARHHNSLAPGQLKGIMQLHLWLSFSHTSYLWGLFPQLPFVPKPLGAAVCDRHSRNGSCTSVWCSTLSVRESSHTCLDVPRLWCGHWPCLLPLKTFLQGQGHSVTDS